MARVSLRDQVVCLREEMRRRRDVYPALVRAGKMTQQAADWQQQAMAQAYKTLRALASIDALVGVRVGGPPEGGPPHSGHDDQDDQG